MRSGSISTLKDPGRRTSCWRDPRNDSRMRRDRPSSLLDCTFCDKESVFSTDCRGYRGARAPGRLGAYVDLRSHIRLTSYPICSSHTVILVSGRSMPCLHPVAFGICPAVETTNRIHERLALRVKRVNAQPCFNLRHEHPRPHGRS